MNSLVNGFITFIDLSALSCLVGTIICLFWRACSISDDQLDQPCIIRCGKVLMSCIIGLGISSIGMLLQRSMVMSSLGIMEVVPVLPTVLFNSHYGTTWLVRAAGVLIALFVWLLGKRHLNSPVAKVFLLVACAAIAFSRSATSHAADNGDFTLQEFSDWFHLLGAISFGGTLLAVSSLFSASSVSDDQERQRVVINISSRLYAIFGPLYAMIVFTGLYNSWLDVGSFEALFTNAYGRLLSVKLLIFLYLTSRFIIPPQKGKDETGYVVKFFKRSRIDAFLVLAIFLFVGLFTQEVPARHAAHMIIMEQNKKESNRQKENGPVQIQTKMTTANGLYSVEIMIPDNKLEVGVNSFDIIVHDKNGKEVIGAEINVVPWMPEMGHGVFDKPEIKEKGDGKYNVDNVVLMMGGRWELRLRIKKDNAEDNVTFSLPAS